LSFYLILIVWIDLEFQAENNGLGIDDMINILSKTESSSFERI
jgi:hypothetical protein